MGSNTKTSITIEAQINAPVEIVWKYWTSPEYITQWNFASDDWHSPWARNDLQKNGKFVFRMEAKDGSFGFDFEGIYTHILPEKLIEYTIGDGRKVRIEFRSQNNGVSVIETFEAESINPIEMQRGGWQAILDNFKKFAESNNR